MSGTNREEEGVVEDHFSKPCSSSLRVLAQRLEVVNDEKFGLLVDVGGGIRDFGYVPRQFDR